MKPETEAELAEMIAAAKGPLNVRGGGTRRIGHRSGDTELQTTGLNGVSLYEPGALTIVVRAGTPLAEVEAVLDAENQRLPFEPMDHRGLLGTQGTPTIGGAVAVNASGPRRIQSGACRDFMLGVRFVDGQGTAIKNGGRVMKNVTGYDLVKLLCGSWGTLGVLSEVSLKVLPKPESAATLALEGLSVSQAVEVMGRALGSPFEISGAAHDPQAGRMLLRIEGFADSVTYRADRLKTLFKGHDMSVETDAARVAQIWAGIRDVSALQAGEGDIWRLSVKPSDSPEIVARLEADALLLDWGGGLIWARLPEGVDLRARLGIVRGHATLVRARPATRATVPAFHPEPEPIARITAGLRARFDPRGILNPGLMDS